MPHYGTVCQELHLTKQYGAHLADSFVDNDVQPQVVGRSDPPLSASALVVLCSAREPVSVRGPHPRVDDLDLLRGANTSMRHRNSRSAPH